MNIRKFFATLFLMGILMHGISVQAQNSTAPNALIMYDAPSGPYQKFGMATSIALRNLLGHFKTTSIAMMPVETYKAGTLKNYDIIFYLGTSYDNPLPAAFLTDLDNNLKSVMPASVVWFKYNLWQIAWDTSNYSFTNSTGITFSSLKGFNSPPTNTNPAPGFYDTVSYKGMSMVKYYAYDSSTNIAAADPDIGATSLSAPAQAVVSISNSGDSTAPALPYVIRSNKFWYIADAPFSYIGPRDRYLVFADLLHDIMGQDHPSKHLGLIRLEDVSADVTTANMKTLVDTMYGQSIPFAIATIPHYRDPYGVYNGGVAENIPLSQAPNLKKALTYALARGGSIVQHGWTHQADDPVQKNTLTGVSGDDYEFWNIGTNMPMPSEQGNLSWPATRMRNGLTELNGQGFTPFAWEAPHYQSSPTSIAANVSIYPKVYGRVVYYTSINPDLQGQSGVYDYAIGQVYPYVIYKDYYGQYVIPENLGNIEHHAICSYCVDYLASDLVLNAKYALVVRDGYASFFFHPYLLDPNVTSQGVNGLKDFNDTVSGIKNLGYTWASPKLQ